MAFQDILVSFTDFFTSLTIQEARLVLEPLIVFVVAMVIYSIFVYKFYKFISRRDIFRLSKGGERSVAKRIGYMLEYIFLFPAIAFLWFFAISVLLSMLSEVLTIGNVFLISMATLATIRLTAYYNEELSKDIAKLIPFALLAVFLLDITGLSISAPIEVLMEIPGILNTIVYYFLFIVFMELIMRVLFHRKPKT